MIQEREEEGGEGKEGRASSGPTSKGRGCEGEGKERGRGGEGEEREERSLLYP